MNFYRESAHILDKLDNKDGSIRSLISTVDEKKRKRTAALVIESLKYRPALLSVIRAAGLLNSEKKTIHSANLAVVLVHDLLLSKGVEASDGVVKQAILRHKTRLQAEWAMLKVKRGARSDQELGMTEDTRSARIPRYVRVNTNMWTIEDAVKDLVNKGYELGEVYSPECTTGKAFFKDQHIKDLLVFPRSTPLQDNPSYIAGKLIFQDKASCFPSTVLDPPRDSFVIDATSAPGNKTSHLSALMQNSGKIYAFERDLQRFKTLQTMVSRAGCTNVESIHADFLRTNPKDQRFEAVTHILLDPSCSGSGIVNRLDYLVETEETDEQANKVRLTKLSSFQLSMIKHAMKFPSLGKLVYSTCSVHPEENEHVVHQAMQSPECQSGKFILASHSQVLPSWHRRGFADQLGTNEAQSLIRCSPGEDGTNGFFVSCFVRQGSVYDVSGPTRGAPATTVNGLANAKKNTFLGDDRKRKAPQDQTVADKTLSLDQGNTAQAMSLTTNSVSTKAEVPSRPKKKRKARRKSGVNSELKSEVSELDQEEAEANWAGIE